jgi:hypothetical protein
VVREPPVRFWLAMLAAIIVAGIVSRLVHTGSVLFDKYLGDALYAAMLYVILRIVRGNTPVVLWACIVMLAIELFQLTGVAATMLMSEHLLVRIMARLLGTHFHWLDLLAYAVGIGLMYGFDSARTERR